MVSKFSNPPAPPLDPFKVFASIMEALIPITKKTDQLMKNKTNFLSKGAPQSYKTQRQPGRVIYHPELRKGARV